MKLPTFSPGRFLYSLVLDPASVRQRLDEEPPLLQQLTLAFEAGWLPLALFLWLGLGLLTAWYDWPIFHPDYFRQVIWLNWDTSFSQNYFFFLRTTFWLWLIWIAAGLIVQFFISVSKSTDVGILFRKDPLLLWFFVFLGIPASFFPITAAFVFLAILFYTQILVYGLFSSNSSEIKIDKRTVNFNPISWLFLIIFFVVVAIFWKTINLAIGLSFEWPEILGVLFFGFIASTINLMIILISHNNAAKTKNRFFFSYLLYLSTFLLCPFGLLWYLEIIDWPNIPRLLLFLASGALIWIVLYNRLWIWCDLSLKHLLGIGNPVKEFPRYQALSIAPIFPNRCIRTFATKYPHESLALASYFLEEKKWTKIAQRLINVVCSTQESNLAADLVAKLKILKKP